MIGQDIAVKVLDNSLKKRKFFKSYLLYGPAGSGKTSLADIFLRTLACIESPFIPCHKCEACLSKETVSNLDSYCAEVLPLLGVYRQAQFLDSSNVAKLVKRFQDKKSIGTYVFTSNEPQKVSPYLRAECLSIPLYKVPLQTLKAYLRRISEKEGWPFHNKVLESISVRANGSVKEALNFLDQASLLEAFEDLPDFMGFDLNHLHTNILLNLQNLDKMLPLVDEALSKTNPSELYDGLARAALESYLSKDYNPLKALHNKKLLAIAGELSKSKPRDASKNDVVCNLLLLETVIADSGKYKSLGFVMDTSTGTSRESVQKKLIKPRNVVTEVVNSTAISVQTQHTAHVETIQTASVQVTVEQVVETVAPIPTTKPAEDVPEHMSAHDLASLLGADMVII